MLNIWTPWQKVTECSWKVMILSINGMKIILIKKTNKRKGKKFEIWKLIALWRLHLYMCKSTVNPKITRYYILIPSFCQKKKKTIPCPST